MATDPESPKNSAPEASLSRDAVVDLCARLVSPLVEGDGGVLYLVEVSGQRVSIHLAGRCGGCPGASFTRDGVILPALRTLSPTLELSLSTGVLVPKGAERVPGAG